MHFVEPTTMFPFTKFDEQQVFLKQFFPIFCHLQIFLLDEHLVSLLQEAFIF